MRNLLIVVATVALALLSIAFLSPWPIWLGTLAAWVTTGSFCLQVLHILKNKDTSGLSLGMWAALFFGVSCWAGYGYQLGDMPVLVANGITAVLAITVLVLKLWLERPRPSVNPRQLVRTSGVIFKMPRIKRLRPLKRRR